VYEIDIYQAFVKLGILQLVKCFIYYSHTWEQQIKIYGDKWIQLMYFALSHIRETYCWCTVPRFLFVLIVTVCIQHVHRLW